MLETLICTCLGGAKHQNVHDITIIFERGISMMTEREGMHIDDSH